MTATTPRSSRTATRRPPANPSRRRASSRAPQSRAPQGPGSRGRQAAPAHPNPAHPNPAHPNPARRLVAVLVVMTMVAGGLGWRLFDVQLRNADALVEIGQRQRFRTVQLAGGRGDIFDRSGNALAVSLPSDSFFADPKFVEDPIGDAERLAPLIGLPVDVVRERLGGEGRFAWLARQTTASQAAEIAALDIPGVFTTEEPTRFHPAGDSLARAVVGNVDIDSLGLSGIEVVENEHLEGRPGELRIEIGLNGDTIPGAPELVDPAEPGSDVHLTLDRALQFEVERVLKRQIEVMAARGGVVIVTQPSTGEVLAMASMTRDEDYAVVSTSLNMATSWSFEPGSVMKAMTFASVLDADLGEPMSTITVPDRYELYDAVFTDSTPHGVADWSIADIITVSSNVGTILWGEQLGGGRLDAYLRSFGFGRSPELGFPGETSGLLIEPDSWGGIATATTALGQGLSVTPVQMLAAFNVLANDGTYVPLQLVREIVRSDGTRVVPAVGEQHQVVSAQAAAQTTTMLENAVAVGTGTNAQVEGYRVAGKTGTARKALDGGSGYLDAAGNFRYVATFVGYLPADEPQLSILVTIDQPSNSIYAGSVSAPVFAEIASWAVRHFHIAPPTQVDPLTSYGLPEVPDVLADRVTGQAAGADPATTTVGQGDAAPLAEVGAAGSAETTIAQAEFADVAEAPPEADSNTGSTGGG